jgi:crotonobetainyl-CoA:carnitine CoA-transferase CaiB-like acyl-CoA transferase
LAGLRVVDLSTVFAVPYLGALLADLGAEVIKVEAPGRLDQSRSSFGASFDNNPGEEYWNRASTFQVLNRGKRSVVLDLNTDSGRAALRAMLADADVLLDNFTPRVMRRWGLTFEALSATNSALVMLSNTGYGSTGPWSSFKAQGTTLEATMGLTTVTGYEGAGPMKAGQSYPDFLACWTGLLALLSALVSRSRTGSGQWIDLGMYQLGAGVIPEAVLAYQVSDTEPVRTGNREAGTIVSGLFATKDLRRWVAVSVDNWSRLLDLEDIAPEVAHVAGVSALVESESAVVLRALLADWIRGQRAEDVVEQLQAVRIAAGPVADARDLIEDPHLRDRGFYEWFDFGELGFRPLIGRPFRWDSSTTVAIRSRAPRFGEHNAEVLCGPGGMSADQYDEALRDGVTATDPIGPPPAQPLRLQDMVERGSMELDESYASRLRSLRP